MHVYLKSLAVLALGLAMSVGCAHRTTNTYSTSETVRTDSRPPEVAPPPPVDESTTVIERSRTRTEKRLQ